MDVTAPLCLWSVSYYYVIDCHILKYYHFNLYLHVESNSEKFPTKGNVTQNSRILVCLVASFPLWAKVTILLSCQSPNSTLVNFGYHRVLLAPLCWVVKRVRTLRLQPQKRPHKLLSFYRLAQRSISSVQWFSIPDFGTYKPHRLLQG